MIDNNPSGESIELFNPNDSWKSYLNKIDECTAYEDFFDDSDVPISVVKTRRNSSGYAWRKVELRRKELICLLLFLRGMNNKQTANLLGISTHVINARSTGLRYKLRFPCREAMVLAARKINFTSYFPATFISSLFDEMQQENKVKMPLFASSVVL